MSIISHCIVNFTHHPKVRTTVLPLSTPKYKPLTCYPPPALRGTSSIWPLSLASLRFPSPTSEARPRGSGAHRVVASPGTRARAASRDLVTSRHHRQKGVYPRHRRSRRRRRSAWSGRCEAASSWLGPTII